MTYHQIATQAVDFQKTAFTHWYNTVTMIQEQSVSAMETMMRQSGLPMPEATRKAVKSWVNTCQEGSKRFHSYIESGFSSIEKVLNQGATVAPAESPTLPVEEKKAQPAPPTLVVAKKKAAAAKKISPAAK